MPLVHWEYTGIEPPRAGLHHPTIAPYGAYASGDGPQAVIAIQTEAEWLALCSEVLKQPDLALDPRFSTNGRRCTNRGALDAEISAVFARLPHRDLVAELREADIAFGKLNTIGEFARHPQLRRIQVDTPTGPVSLPAPPQISMTSASSPARCRMWARRVTPSVVSSQITSPSKNNETSGGCRRCRCWRLRSSIGLKISPAP